MNKPHKHAEFIKAKADGHTIQWDSRGTWNDMDESDWVFPTNIAFRIKPEPEYPKSQLSYSALSDIVNTAYSDITGEGKSTIIARLAADAGIKQAIIDGQVIINPDYKNHVEK